jgi:plasmid rolling circle replication initiator protein Rep
MNIIQQVSRDFKPPGANPDAIITNKHKFHEKATLARKRAVQMSMAAAFISAEAKQRRLDFDAGFPNSKNRSSRLLASGLSLESSRTKKRSERMAECAHYVRVKACPEGHESHIHRAVLCHDRMCPLCNWMRSERLSTKFNVVINKVLRDAANPPDPDKKYGGRFLHIGATIPNPPDGALKPVHALLRVAAAKFIRDKRVRKMTLGSARAIETTRKHASWHPHLHFLLNVSEDYFSEDNPYARAPEGPKLWMKIWVDILESLNWRRFYPAEWQAKDECGNYIRKITDFKINAVRKGKEHKAAVEVTAKYIVKDENVADVPVHLFVELMRAVYRAKLWITTGSLHISDKEIENFLVEGLDSDGKTALEAKSGFCSQCHRELIEIDLCYGKEHYCKTDSPISWPMSKSLASLLRRCTNEKLKYGGPFKHKKAAVGS